MARPLASVVIDTYNQERFIAEAIESVLAQDFPREQMEILVVDDGSTDRTPEIVRQFEPHVRLLRKENGGQASAINYGVAHASGEFVAFLDGDDVWLPAKLSRVVHEFLTIPPAVMVYHRYVFWDCRDDNLWEPDHFAEISGDLLADARRQRLFVGAPTSALAFRREALLRVAPVPEECSFMQDIYLMGTTICLGPVACLSSTLMKYRVHGANLCFTDREEPDLQVLRNRIETWEASIGCLQDWIHTNASQRTLHKVRFLVRRWRLMRESDQLRLQTTGRLRQFLYLCRYALVQAPRSSRGHVAYLWLKALAVLVAGRHAHYLEAARTRARRFAALASSFICNRET